MTEVAFRQEWSAVPSVPPRSLQTRTQLTFGPIGTVGVKTIFTATVEYQGQTLMQTLRATCEPTTQAECKNNGWRDFGVFKSQGDCVSYVASGRKNAAAP